MKRVFALVLLLCMAGALAACGSTPTEPATSAGSTAAPSESQAPATQGVTTGGEDTWEDVLVQLAEAESQDEAAFGTDVLKIGVLGSMTGPMAINGTSALNAAKVWQKLVNDNGGVRGHQLELVVYDDQADPALTLKGATKLIEEENVAAILTCATSSCAMAIQDYVEEQQIPIMGCVTSTSVCNQGYEYTFRSEANTDFITEGMVQGALLIGGTKAGIIHFADDYGVSIKDGVEKYAPLHGLEITAVESIQMGDNDFTSALTKIISSGADTIMIGSSQELLGLIAKQARQLGFEGVFSGCEGAGAKNVRDVGGEAVDGLVFAASYLIADDPADPMTPQQSSYMKEYYALHNAYPDALGGYRAFDGIVLLTKAINEAGTISGPEVRDAIENITYTGLVGPYNYVGRGGEGLPGAVIYIIHNNKNYSYEDYLAEVGE